MRKFTIANHAGRSATIMLASHRQHVWHTSHAKVSASVLARIRRDLGEQEYYLNSHGHFGRAQRVYLRLRA